MGNRREGAQLVAEDLQGKPRVQFRVVDAAPLELSVLVMLDQMVIGIAGKGQWIQAEGVHRRQTQQFQPGIDRPQMRKVEINQVVAEKEVRAGCEVVQLGQSLWQPVSCARKEKGLTGIPTDSGESPDAPVPYGDLQVDR